MEIPVIYEDEYLVVINKPAGVVVNRAESVVGQTVQDWMDSKYQISPLRPPFAKGFGVAQRDFEGQANIKYQSDEEKEFVNRSGVVHRLDKETSGVMVLAKDADTFQNLKNQFKNRVTRKQYMALVHGHVQPKEGTINLPLKRNILNRHRFAINVDGKMARTKYRVEEYLSTNQTFTLVRLFPKTGRTHQLRVHLSHLGYPIVSDPTYLGKRLKEDLTWCPRLFLHAHSLSFIHPKTEKRVEYTAELSRDLKQALDTLIN